VTATGEKATSRPRVPPRAAQRQHHQPRRPRRSLRDGAPPATTATPARTANREPSSRTGSRAPSDAPSLRPRRPAAAGGRRLALVEPLDRLPAGLHAPRDQLQRGREPAAQSSSAARAWARHGARRSIASRPGRPPPGAPRSPRRRASSRASCVPPAVRARP
jgi:hypothetical protein